MNWQLKVAFIMLLGALHAQKSTDRCLPENIIIQKAKKN